MRPSNLVLKMALSLLWGYLFAIYTATTDHHGPRYVILLMDIFNNRHTGPLSDTLDPTNLFSTHQATVIFQKTEIRIRLLLKIFQWYQLL